MPIHADKNQYPGINAHLNSFLQNEPGGWASFHGGHVTHLGEFLDKQLPTGYFVRSEKSLQVRGTDPETGDSGRGRTIPDVTVFRSGGLPESKVLPTATLVKPRLSLPIPETFEDEEFLNANVIYQAGEGSLLGRPITRVELLSPANKPGGAHFEQYMHKRLETLKSGLRLVEIDYLHETPPIIHKLPSYPDRQQSAFPYAIFVSDPRPTFEQGKTDIYRFGIVDPIPVLTVPLAGADTIQFDFGAVYHHTFASARFYRMVVDYEQDPLHFERYSEADRERLKSWLTTLRENTEQKESRGD